MGIRSTTFKQCRKLKCKTYDQTILTICSNLILSGKIKKINRTYGKFQYN